ncbi:Serine/threonine kinase mps1 [Cystobasidiomycetes sp. EMM_F5]
MMSNSSGNGYVTNLSNITDVSPPAQGVDVGERLRKGDTSTAMMALRDSAQERAQLVSTSSYDISVSARGPSMPQEQEAESTQSRTDNQADAHSDTLVPADTRDGRRTRAAAGNNEYRVYSDQEGADEVEVILDIAQPTTTDNDVNQDKENNHVDQRYAAAALTKTSMPLLGAADLRNSRTADRHVLGEVKRLLQPQVSNVDVLSAKLPSLSLEGRQHTQVPFSQPLPQPPQRIGKSSSSSSNGGYGYHPADRQIISNDYAVPTKQSGDTPPDSHSAASYAAAYRPAPGLPLQHLAQLPHKSAVHSATAASEQPAPTASRKTAGLVTVKGKTYTRMGLLGKGGSSKVFRVSDREHQIFALKKVDLGKGADSETYQAFLNEIDLLERLKGHDRIIQLVASEVNEARRSLIMVMEIGEIDMNALLQERQGKRVSMNFIRHTWEQMLEAVNVIHDVGIVHTDLKPANFVLVKGALKLIDFGIAKAIPNDTTNIARDQQVLYKQ